MEKMSKYNPNSLKILVVKGAFIGLLLGFMGIYFGPFLGGFIISVSGFFNAALITKSFQNEQKSENISKIVSSIVGLLTGIFGVLIIGNLNDLRYYFLMYVIGIVLGGIIGRLYKVNNEIPNNEKIKEATVMSNFDGLLNFGTKTKIIAIFRIYDIISIILTGVTINMYYFYLPVSDEINSIFMNINLISSIIAGLSTISILIQTLFSLRKINKLTERLRPVGKFRANFISAHIFKFIYTLIFIFIFVFEAFTPAVISHFPEKMFFFRDLAVGLLFMWNPLLKIIGVLFEINAWSKLEDFFKIIASKFPENFKVDGLTAVKRLKLGNKIMIIPSIPILLLLPSFGILMLMEIIGMIFYIIGIINLGRVLNFRSVKR